MTRVLWLVPFAALVSAAAAADDKKKDTFKLTKDEQELIDQTNAERKKEGLEPLKPNRELTEAARSHAMNMAKQQKMEHELDGKTPADRVLAAGYKYARTGENIARSFRTPKVAVEKWMGSPPHKENILNKTYTEIGVAVARSASGEPYWVQVFGTPRR